MVHALCEWTSAMVRNLDWWRRAVVPQYYISKLCQQWGKPRLEPTIGDAVMPEFHMLHAYTYKPRGPHCVASRGRSYGNWKLPFNLPPLILQTGGARVGCRRTSYHAWCIVMASWPQSGVVFSRLLYGIVGCLTSHYQESIWEAVYSTLFFEWLDEVSAKEWKWQLRIAALCCTQQSL